MPKRRLLPLVQFSNLGIVRRVLPPQSGDDFTTRPPECLGKLFLGDLEPLFRRDHPPALEVRMIRVDENAIHIEDNSQFLHRRDPVLLLA